MTVVIPERWSVIAGERVGTTMLRVLHKEMPDRSLILNIEQGGEQSACRIEGHLPAPTNEEAALELERLSSACGWPAAQLLILLSRIMDLDCTAYVVRSEETWLQIQVFYDGDWAEIKEDIRDVIKQAFEVDLVDFRPMPELRIDLFA